MISELDEYVINCVANGKKPSGRKISGFLKDGISYTKTESEIYSLAKNTEIPICKICNFNKVELISFSKGFRKYCSKDCYGNAQSDRNKKNNKYINKALSDKKRIQNEKTYKNIIDLAINQYIKHENILSIREISRVYEIPHGILSAALLDYFGGKIPTDKKSKIWKEKLRKKMSHVDVFLNDKEWLSSQQSNGKTTSLIAKELGCSSNYVASKSRKLGIPFPNNISTSSYELNLKNFLLSKDQSVESNNRRVLSGLEIDIFIPDKNFGIEVNGVYWHQFDESKNTRIDMLYHKRKTDLAEEKGIQLIHVFDYELEDARKKSIIESIILNNCKVNKKISARKCIIKEIDFTSYSKFLDANHIEGSLPSIIKFGLYHGGDLVMVGGFTKPTSNKNHEWEMIRLCSKKGICVVGGATKIFKNFVKKYSPNSIISYCNRKYFNGNVYKYLGMKECSLDDPNYTWVKNTSTGFKIVDPKNIKKTFTIYNEDKLMREDKYMKIYDSGQSVFVWSNVYNFVG